MPKNSHPMESLDWRPHLATAAADADAPPPPHFISCAIPEEGDPLLEDSASTEPPPASSTDTAATTRDDDDAGKPFLATKPWLGALYPPMKYREEPTNLTSRETVFTEENNNWSLPETRIELDYVFGYRVRQCRNNVYWIDTNRVVFFAGEVCIIYDASRDDQDYFTGHDDDVVCIDYHPGTGLCASGSIGARNTAQLCIWDVDKANVHPGAPRQARHILSGFHMYAVVSVNFNPSGTLVVSLGMDDHHSCAVYCVETGQLLATTEVDKSRIVEVKYNTSRNSLDPDACFVTCGHKHIEFWGPTNTKVSGSQAFITSPLKIEQRLVGRRGTKCSVIDQVVFTCIENAPSHTLVGATNGNVYAFDSRNYVCSFSVTVDKTPIQALCAMDPEGTCVATGTQGGIIRLFDFTETSGAPSKSFLTQDGSCDININRLDEATDNDSPVFVNSVRSVSYQTETKRLLVGTILSHIYAVTIPLSKKEAPSSTTIVSGHWGNLRHPEGYGEIWGIVAHPTEQTIYSTSSDGTVRKWDIDQKNREVRRMHLLHSGMNVDVSLDGAMVAVGHLNGSWEIVDAALTCVMWPNTRDRRQRVADIRFSPNVRFLAVGAEMVVDVYSIVRDDPSTTASGAAFATTPLGKLYKLAKNGVIATRIGVCRGHTGTVRHLDWNLASTLLQCTSDGCELLYFTMPDCGRVTGARYLADQQWFTQKCHFGWSVQGIWPRFSDSADINGVSRSHAEDLIATTDNNGQVNVYNYPCVGSGMDRFGQMTHRPSAVVLRGHSAHVTNCVWTPKDKFLVTVGGSDLCIMVWKVTRPPGQGKKVFIDAEFVAGMQKVIDEAMAKTGGKLPTGTPLSSGVLCSDVQKATDPAERLKKLQERLSHKEPEPLHVPQCTMCSYTFENDTITTCPRCMMPRLVHHEESTEAPPVLLKARKTRPKTASSTPMVDSFAAGKDEKSTRTRFDVHSSHVLTPTHSFAALAREALAQRREMQDRTATQKWVPSMTGVSDPQTTTAFRATTVKSRSRVDVESDDSEHDARLIRDALSSKRQRAKGVKPSTPLPATTAAKAASVDPLSAQQAKKKKATRVPSRQGRPTSGPSFVDV